MAQLRRECDDLLAAAVRRPYGWAWPAAIEPTRPAESRKAPHTRVPPPEVELSSPGSAAVGFVLFWAADLLDEPRYREAAHQAAKGIGAAERASGLIPAHPIFLTGGAGGKEEVTLVADRAPACAALGLVLTIIDEGGRAESSLQQTASRASFWLMKQQTGTGAWPEGYPAATQPKDAIRLMRLDSRDFRDSTLAMLYAYEVLQNPLHRSAVERSVELLLRCRLGVAAAPGSKLWTNAYQLDGQPSGSIENEVLSGIDALASRYAVQTLLADYLVLGHPPAGKAIDEAVTQLIALPHTEGLWGRIYDSHGLPYRIDPRAAPATQDLFHTASTRPTISVTVQTGDFGWGTLAPAATLLKTETRAAYEKQLTEHLSIRQEIAATLVGLSDDPFTTILPVSSRELAAYIKDHEVDRRVLEGAPPTDLAGRSKRLWLLYLRARLEHRFGV